MGKLTMVPSTGEPIFGGTGKGILVRIQPSPVPAPPTETAGLKDGAPTGVLTDDAIGEKTKV